MDISEIRRQNMLLLIDGFKTQADFAEKIDKPASYISQIKKGRDNKGKEINMGTEFARDIETKLGLEFGWLDNHHTIAHQVNSGNFHNSHINQNIQSSQVFHQVATQVDIPLYQNANITTIGTYTINQNLLHGEPQNLFAVPVLGREMQPLLMDKAMAIADKSKVSIGIYDGQVYALQMGESIRCRYLEVVAGGRVRVYSEQNKEGETFDQAEFDKHYQILGGVVWQSSFFNW